MFDDVTSGEKASLFRSRDWRHFRGPTREDIVQLPVAHAQNILPVRTTLRSHDWRDFRSRDFR